MRVITARQRVLAAGVAIAVLLGASAFVGVRLLGSSTPSPSGGRPHWSAAEHAARGDANLTVAVGDLPAGLDARVLVAGPQGFLHHLASAGTMYDIPAGRYDVWGDPVSDRLFTYYEQESTVVVNDRDTASVTASYYTATPASARVLADSEHDDVIAVTPQTVVVRPTPSTRQIVPGGVVLSRPVPGAATGLIRRVMSATQEPDRVVLRTVPAALDEAFARLRVGEAVRTSWRRAPPAGAPSGQPSASVDRGCSATSSQVGPSGDAGLRAGLSEAVDAVFNASFAVDQPAHLQRLAFTVSAQIRDRFALTLAAMELRCQGDGTIAAFDASPVVIPTPAGVPIVLSPHLDLDWSLNASAGVVQLTSQATMADQPTVGFSWENGRLTDLSQVPSAAWSPRIAPRREFAPTTIDSAEGFRLSVGLYEAAQLTAGVDWTTELNLTPLDSPSWTLKGIGRELLDSRGPIFSGADMPASQIADRAEQTLLGSAGLARTAEPDAAFQGEQFRYDGLRPQGGVPPYSDCQPDGGSTLPSGITLSGCSLVGVPSTPGDYQPGLVVRDSLPATWDGGPTTVPLRVYASTPAFPTPEAAAQAWIAQNLHDPSASMISANTPYGAQFVPQENQSLPDNLHVVSFSTGRGSLGGYVTMYLVRNAHGWHVLNAGLGAPGIIEIGDTIFVSGCSPAYSAPSLRAPLASYGCSLEGSDAVTVDGVRWADGRWWWHLAQVGWLTHEDLTCGGSPTDRLGWFFTNTGITCP